VYCGLALESRDYVVAVGQYFGSYLSFAAADPPQWRVLEVEEVEDRLALAL